MKTGLADSCAHDELDLSAGCFLIHFHALNQVLHRYFTRDLQGQARSF